VQLISSNKNKTQSFLIKKKSNYLQSECEIQLVPKWIIVGEYRVFSIFDLILRALLVDETKRREEKIFDQV